MTLLNYREVEERFSHIDATFISADVSLPTREARYSVRFYPWWEHPHYLGARALGNSWRFQYGEDAKQLVTVIAHEVYAARLSRSAGTVTDWSFHDDHPLLWAYHQRHQLLCTTALTSVQLTALIDLVRIEAGHYENPYRFLNVPRDTATFYEWAATGAFVLGNFPAPLYHKVITFLDQMGVRYLDHGRFEPALGGPVLFIVGDDYIIATDFTIEVSKFTHEPEWFVLNAETTDDLRGM